MRWDIEICPPKRHAAVKRKRQRVAIARSMVNNPTRVSDELSGNLDHKTTESIFELIQKLNQEQKIAFLLVTHDLQLAEKLGRRLVMQDGILRESNS